MNLKEWKDKNKKTFDLKSGLTITVRRLPGFILGEVGPLPKLEDSGGPQDQLITARKVVEMAVIHPKVGTGENELSVWDLTVADINEIVNNVVLISGRAEDSPLAEGDG